MQVSRFGPPQTWVSRFGPPKRAGFQVWTPPGNLHVLGANLETCTFGGVQTCRPARLGGPNLETWKPARFGTWKPAARSLTFPGLDPLNVQVSRFSKCAGFQVWTPQNVDVSRFQNEQVSRFGPAGFQVWTLQNVDVSRFGPPKTCKHLHVWEGPNLQTCTFWGSKPGNLLLGVQTWKPARFKGLKPGNVNVLGVQTWKPARLGGPNLETCTFWGAKPGNVNVLGGPNLETCTFWKLARFGRSKPRNLHVLGGPNLETCTFGGGSKPGNLRILGGPNLETCTFGGPNHVLGGLNLKPARLGPNLETCTFCLRVLAGPNLETCPAYPEIVESLGDGIIFLARETMQYRFKDLETSTKPLHSNRDRNVWALCTSPMMSLKGPKFDSRLKIRIETMIS